MKPKRDGGKAAKAKEKWESLQERILKDTDTKDKGKTSDETAEPQNPSKKQGKTKKK